MWFFLYFIVKQFTWKSDFLYLLKFFILSNLSVFEYVTIIIGHF